MPDPPVANLRDVGGHPIGDGARLRRGVLYRSAELDKLDKLDPGDPTLARLGVRTVYDLRTDGERRARPDRLPDGVRYLVADVLAGSSEPSPAELMPIFADPRLAAETFGEGRGVAFFVRTYREFVHLDSARAAFRRVLTDLADPDLRPGLIHCTTGKDRTGWLAAALLLWLGVSEEEVMDDFLASTRALEPTFRPFLDAFEARGGDPAVLRPLMGVRPEYLEAALLETRRTYGDLERYFSVGLGLDADVREGLRAAFIVRR